MKKKIHTLEIEVTEKLGMRETVAEVDYDLDGFIYDIRVYSEYFEACVSVNEKWLENNFPVRLKTLRNAVEIEIANKLDPSAA